jgi:hypothetical protein
MHLANGYSLLYTPHIAKVDLWKTSGHLEHYRDSMFNQMQVCVQTSIPRKCAMKREHGVGLLAHVSRQIPKLSCAALFWAVKPE